MKKGQNLWTREELILAMNLYWKLEFGKFDMRNPEVKSLSQLIGRSPGAVAFKLTNLASLDPSLQERGIKGSVNSSKLDRQIWDEFYENPHVLPYESEKLRAQFENTDLEKLHRLSEDELPKEGKEREAYVRVRVNQSMFRQAVLQSYQRCCITGIENPSLLIAGHIIPWAKDEKKRMNPRNGLLFNPLHDKAYEHGLITIRPDYTILISSQLKEDKEVWTENFFAKYHGKKMLEPKRFFPDPSFLDQHYSERFKK